MTKRKLYATLGVPDDATTDEIKKAYRSKAHKAHPDKNKEPDAPQQFHAIVKAYDVLSDPKRRKKYDESGEEGGVQDEAAELRHDLTQLILDAIDHTENVDAQSPIELAKRHIIQEVEEARSAIREMHNRARKLNKALKRIKGKKIDTGRMVSHALSSRIDAIEKEIEGISDRIKRLETLLEMLMDFDYLVDRTPPTTGGFSQFFRTS